MTPQGFTTNRHKLGCWAEIVHVCIPKLGWSNVQNDQSLATSLAPYQLGQVQSPQQFDDYMVSYIAQVSIAQDVQMRSSMSSAAQGSGRSSKDRNPMESYERAWLLWTMDGGANPLMARKVAGVSGYLFVCLSSYPTQLSVCLSVYLSSCWSVCLFACPSVHLFCCLPFCLSIHPSMHPSRSAFVHPSIHLSISHLSAIHIRTYLSIHPSTHPSICLSVYPSIHLPVSLSICPSICDSTYLSLYWASFIFCLHICLSVDLCICLSVYLSKLFCETSLKCGSWKLENMLFCEASFKFGGWHNQNRSNSARHPHFLKLGNAKTKQCWRPRWVQCWRHRANALCFVILPLHLSKVVCLPRTSEPRSYEVPHLSHKIVLATVKIWYYKCSHSREISTLTSYHI